MKKYIQCWLLAAVLLLNVVFIPTAYADENVSDSISVTREIPSDTSIYESTEYKDRFEAKVESYFTPYATQSGKGLEKAFDNDINTIFETGPSISANVTTITITFDKPYELNRIMYTARQDHNGDCKGYPKTLTIFSSETVANECEKVSSVTSTPTDKTVIFRLSKPITAEKIQFQWTDVASNWASAAELKFFSYDEVLDSVQKMFTDESEKQLNEEFKNADAVSALKEAAAGHPLEEYLNTKFERAENILAGKIGWEYSESAKRTITRKFVTSATPYTADEYRKNFEAGVKSYSASRGAYSGHGLSQAFDNNLSTLFETGQNLSQGVTTVTVTFDRLYDISRIMYAVRQDTGDCKGYPKTLTVLASSTAEGECVKIGSVTSSSTRSTVIFRLSQPVYAEKIQLQWTDVDNQWASAAELKFFSYDEVLDTVENIFTDSNENQLYEQYKSEEIIATLREKASGHLFEDYLNEKLDLADKIVTGEIDEKDFPNKTTTFPVQVIQKTGNDAERIVWIFAGDGYTADQQDKFVNDVNERVKNILSREPFRQYANDINIYAIMAVSNESGSGRWTNASGSWKASVKGDEYYKDTYFKAQFYGWGIDRLGSFTGNGKSRFDALRKELLENYLDEGATILSSNLLCNENTYYGAGGSDYAIASLSSGANMVLHEASHAFAGLADEYNSSPNDSPPNKTTQSDPLTTKWKEYIGFRGTGLWAYGSGNWIPSKSKCIMENLYVQQYCEVCKEHVAYILNNRLSADKRDLYVAQPTVTIALDEPDYINFTSGAAISNSNITNANNKKIEFRTIARNLSNTEQTVTAEFSITDKNGNVKHNISEEFIIPVGERKNLCITTDTLTDLEQGDEIAGKIIDSSGNVLATDKTASAEYATVNIDCVLKDGKKVPNVSTMNIPIAVGESYEENAPELSGYVFVGSSLENGSIDVSSSNPISVKYYYVPEKTKVTLTLLNESGNELAAKYRYIRYGQTYTPSYNDFPSIDGYTLALPNAVTYDDYDNADTKLEYTYNHIHSYTMLVSEKQEPTCTEKGKEAVYKCATCDLTTGGEEIAVLGHDYAKTVVAPTTASQGYTVYTCTRCGDTYKADYTDKLPSTDTNTNTNSNTSTTDNSSSTTDSTVTPTAEESKIAEQYGVDNATAKQIVAVLDKYNVSDSTAALTEKAMTSTVPKNDGDYAGSSFGLLKAKATNLKKNSITVKWNKVKGADGYIIYGAKCGSKSKYKKIATVSASKTSYTQKKLKKGTYYKYNVVAYKNVNGVKVTIAASKKIHAITKGGKYGVAKSVKLNKSKVTLKKGKKFQIKASEVKQDKKIKKHRKLCYESSNTKVATVNSKGKITAKKKGKCTIYVYAQNGVYKTITVTVK